MLYWSHMEGPSLVLAAERLQPFVGKPVLRVRGDAKIGIERLKGKKPLEIFSWGKHLVFQFDTFALRIHFMMFGTYEATVEGKPSAGDYPRSSNDPRLALAFKNGHFDTYNCSVKFIESKKVRDDYDFTVNVLSDAWDPKAALKKLRSNPDREIADVLLDQTIFAGVGNIIRNEVLWLEKIHPRTPVGQVPAAKLRAMVAECRDFCEKFYQWRKDFVLKQHLKIYRKPKCPRCGAKTAHEYTTVTKRRSHICPQEQVLPRKAVPTRRSRPQAARGAGRA